MREPASGPLHRYLAGVGVDGRGRHASNVLGFSDEQLENTHDYIQWLFPLAARSGAQPDAPVLTDVEAAAIRQDQRAMDTLERATDRMLRFYRDTTDWLSPYDHNHLRITRIIRSLKLLAGAGAARRFHDAIMALNAAAGARINARSLRFWEDAIAEH
jgi:hypothetical protein